MILCFKVLFFLSLFPTICACSRDHSFASCPGFAYSSSLSVLFMKGVKDKGEHLYFQMSVDEGLAVGDDWPFAHLQRTSFPLIFLWNYHFSNGYIPAFSFACQTLVWPALCHPLSVFQCNLLINFDVHLSLTGFKPILSFSPSSLQWEERILRSLAAWIMGCRCPFTTTRQSRVNLVGQSMISSKRKLIKPCVFCIFTITFFYIVCHF